jgi:hypothetical protein
MKLATIFALIGSAAAFAPVSQTTRATTSVSAWVDETVVGVTAPVGFFDPIGLSKGKSDATMTYYREAELKHGRVSMAACLGWFITAGGVHPAFHSSLSSDPLEAAHQLPFVGWLQFIVGCGAIEWLTEKIKERPGYVAGDVLLCLLSLESSLKTFSSRTTETRSSGTKQLLILLACIS